MLSPLGACLWRKVSSPSYLNPGLLRVLSPFQTYKLFQLTVKWKEASVPIDIWPDLTCDYDVFKKELVLAFE